jgi:hemerythrin
LSDGKEKKMAIQWEESLQFGIPAIDEQHKAMFDHFVELSDAIKNGLSYEEVEKLLDYLNEYVSTHFEEEEQLMARYHYSGLEEQRLQHAHFKENVIKLSDMLTDKVPAKELALRIDATLIRYVINHIRNFDSKVVDFLKKSGKDEAYQVAG